MLATAVSAAAQQPLPPSLQERMSQDDFRAAGLDKLSPQELQRLDSWLAAHPTTEVKYVKSDGKPEFYPESGARETVQAHIDGTFYGWRGKTVFKLDNGQEWRQAESGLFDARKMDSPAVKIKPMLLGSWLMYVDGCGCSVRVTRVK